MGQKCTNCVRMDEVFFHFYFFTLSSQCKWSVNGTSFCKSNLKNIIVKVVVPGPVKQYEVFLLSSMKCFCISCTTNLNSTKNVTGSLYLCVCVSIYIYIYIYIKLLKNFIGKGGSIPYLACQADKIL